MPNKLMEQLRENSALAITSTIESMLRNKTVEAIDETRKQVAAETFGMSFDVTPEMKVQEESVIDAAWNGKAQLDERSEVDHPLAKELADKAVHNHHEFHSGNHDARHGGWAMHDLHTWAKNYAKKKAKGVYDKELAVKGLTHAIKNSEPSYFGKAHHEKSGQTVSGATRTQAARHLLPHVEKLMGQHKPKAKKVNEADEHSQAFGDWTGRKAYWQQTGGYGSKTGYYKMKGGGKAPWSDSVKKRYKDTGEFHKAAHAFNEGEIQEFQGYGPADPNHPLNRNLPQNRAKQTTTKTAPPKFGYKAEDPNHPLNRLREAELTEDRWKVDGEKVLKNHGFNFEHRLDMPAGKGSAKRYLHPLSGHNVVIHRTGHWSTSAGPHASKGQGSESLDQHLKTHHKSVSEAAAAAAIPMDGYQIRARQKAAGGQSDFNKKWHAAKGNDAARKELKKHAFHHDYDIPDDEVAHSHSKSPIHSFAEHMTEQVLSEAGNVPYPQKSKHLQDYKPASDSEHEMHLNHPAGHSLTWHKKDNTFTHTSASGKTKKGKMVDLHPHLMKVHHDFDNKVNQHMKDHLHDRGYGLLTKMGKLEYAHEKHPEGRDHEDDAVNHKAMKSAYLKLTKRERGVK
jgi:hypothetical protein